MTRPAPRVALLIVISLSFVAPARALLAQPAVEQVDSKCLWCHGEDLLTQQRLTRRQWVGVVDRMRNWGADIVPRQVDELAAHLAERYPAAAPAPSVSLIEPSDVDTAREPQGQLKGAQPARGEPLFKAHCARCHGEDACGTRGPALVGRPVLVRLNEWRDVLLHGRRGMRGSSGKLNAAQRLDILAFVRKLRQVP